MIKEPTKTEIIVATIKMRLQCYLATFFLFLHRKIMGFPRTVRVRTPRITTLSNPYLMQCDVCDCLSVDWDGQDIDNKSICDVCSDDFWENHKEEEEIHEYIIKKRG